MKIAPRNALQADKTLNGQSERYTKTTRQDKNESKKIDSDKNEFVFSSKLVKNDLGKNTKTINNTIGKLQIAIKNIDKVSEMTKKLEVTQETNPTKSKEIQENITKTLNNANFNGENVFEQPYEQLAQNVKFKAYTIKPIKLDNTKNILDFKKNLVTQKQYAKETISFLEKKLQDSLNTINDKQGITSKNFNTFDKSIIQNEQFKNAHNTQGLTRENLARLLG